MKPFPGASNGVMARKSSSNSVEALADDSLSDCIARRDHTAFEALMRRHNSRLYRVARAILKDESEAEDALQDAYLDAYRHLGQFRGGAQMGTWLTRIVINHALMRLRRLKKRGAKVVCFKGATNADAESTEMNVTDGSAESPHDAALRSEVRRLIERRIDELPLGFRTAFVMREVEEMSVPEIADILGVSEATVRTRVFRARGLLRAALARDVDRATLQVFAFEGARCDRIVRTVLARVAQLENRVERD